MIDHKGELKSKEQLLESFNSSRPIEQSQLQEHSSQNSDYSDRVQKNQSIQALQHNILAGNIRESVDSLIHSQNWEHALILSYLFDQNLFRDVISSYTNNALTDGTLKKLYLLCSGGAKHLFDTTSPSISERIATNNNVWRDCLYLLLSCYSLDQSNFKSSMQHLGEYLASMKEAGCAVKENSNNNNENNYFNSFEFQPSFSVSSSQSQQSESSFYPYIESAHFCYLLSGGITLKKLLESVLSTDNNKIPLIGINTSNSNVKNFIDAFQRSEIYEYSQMMSLDKSAKDEPPLVNGLFLYRYYYALFLTDYELFDQALSYTTYLKSALKKSQKQLHANKAKSKTQMQYIQALSDKVEELVVRIDNFKGKQSSMSSIGKSFLSGLFGKVLNAAIGDEGPTQPQPQSQNQKQNQSQNQKQNHPTQRNQPVTPVQPKPQIQEPKFSTPQIPSDQGSSFPMFSPAPFVPNVISNPFGGGSSLANDDFKPQSNNEPQPTRSYDPFDPFSFSNDYASNSESNITPNSAPQETKSSTVESSSNKDADDYDPFFIPSSTPVPSPSSAGAKSAPPSTPTPSSSNTNNANTEKKDENSSFIGRVFSKLWRKKDMDLGEQNTFHYDPVLKKWVNKVCIFFYDFKR